MRKGKSDAARVWLGKLRGRGAGGLDGEGLSERFHLLNEGGVVRGGGEICGGRDELLRQ